MGMGELESLPFLLKEGGDTYLPALADSCPLLPALAVASTGPLEKKARTSLATWGQR